MRFYARRDHAALSRNIEGARLRLHLDRTCAIMRIMTDAKAEIEAVERKLIAIGKGVPEFARAAGVHPSTWRRWRNGETSPNLRTWQKVAAELARLEVQMEPAE